MSVQPGVVVSYYSPELCLEHLLRRCFSVPDLRMMLFRLPDQGDLKDHLPVMEGATPASYARQAVLVLVARSLVGRPLFEAIAAEREMLAPEIWAVAEQFGVESPLAGSLLPLPEEYSQYADANAELRTFVGRTKQLEQLQEVLLPRSGLVRAAVVCNLRGMAGVGKSFLVERFFMEQLERFPGGHLKIILGDTDAPTGDDLLRDLAERLGVALQGAGRLEHRVRAAAMAFRALLHLDNVDSEAQARGAAALVARLPGVCLVVTGRFRFDERTPGWRLVPVDPFDEADALAQLRLELTEENNKRISEDDRRALVMALHGLPLAIRLAASYLNEGYRVEDFLSELKSAGLNLPHRQASASTPLDRAQLALRATFDISLTALSAMLGDEAEEGMRGVAALGVAPLAGIGRDLLNTIVGAEPARVIRWVRQALRLSLVRFEAVPERWRVHKLLSEWLRLLDPEETPRALGRLDGWMLMRLPEKPDETRGTRWGELQKEHECVGEWVTGLDGERAVLGGRIGFDYALVSGPFAAWLGAVARGLHATANAEARSELLWRQGNLAQRAGELNLAVLAAEAQRTHAAAYGWDREAALAAGLLADVHQARGQFDEALRIRREEESPVYERLGDMRSIAATMGKIADVLQTRGQLDEALRIRWEEEIPVHKRLGDMHSHAITMGKIADVHQVRGQLDVALQIYTKEVLPIFEQLGDVRSTANGMSRIADILQTRGQLNEVLQIRRERLLPIYERLGDVCSVAVTQDKIADVLQSKGQLDEALRIRMKEVLPIFERLGDVRRKANTMGSVADTHQARGQLDEALRIRTEEVLPVYEQLGDVRSKAVTMGKIADLHFARGRLDEALRIREEEVLPVYERLGDARSKAVTMSKIADIHQALGQLDESLRIRREEVLPVVERLGDKYHKAITMGKIADVYQARGQLDEALRIRKEEELPVYEQLGDVYHKAVTMGRIADVCQARGQLDEALKIRWEDELPVHERLGGVGEQAVTLSKIADALTAQGQLEEAIRIRRERVLPAFATIGATRELLRNQTNLAVALLRTHKPEHLPEALTLLTTALKSAVERKLPVEIEHIRGLFRQINLTPPH